ncbi:DSD1 family PLP-dependent enzyme [[Eubacterium] cellulosolvens]
MNIIGQEKNEIDTPALLIDIDIMKKNLRLMADFFRDKSAKLRPHTKVHRCPAIANMQIKEGAKGICCQKVGEAEVMAEAGLNDIIVTNEVVTPSKIQRLLALTTLSTITVPIDNPDNASLLSKLTLRSKTKLNVLIDIHMGSQRCGVEPGEPAVKLAKHVMKLKGLYLKGLMGFEGHISWMMPREKRQIECEKLENLLLETKKLFEQEGIPVEEISTGTTGTYDITAKYIGITEVQAGTYILMDHIYHKYVPEFTPALSVLSTVISTPSPQRAITDIGIMSMNTSYGLPVLKKLPDIEVKDLHAENTILQLKKSLKLKIGQKIEFLPTYIDGTVNLHNQFHVIRKGKLEAIWNIQGRGRSV